MPQNPAFERATPESQGVSSPAITKFVEGVESHHLGLHSFMLLRHGRVVAEAWWRPFVPDLPHVLYSLTKSFTSTAAGFAIAEGKLSLDDKVLSFFPNDTPKDPSENWRAMGVRHLLTMTTGHEEDPGLKLSQYPPRDWMRRLLETPLPYPPGTHFVYNSTASHLVSLIVQKVTGQKLVNHLRDRLFRPLGISRPYWDTDPLDRNWGGFGLYLRTDEIARFGQALLQRGAWQGQQVIPAEWVDQATRKQVSNGDDPNSDWAQGYGFQFWISRHGYRGDGAFGQFCVVLPEHDSVLVTTAATTDMQAVLNTAWQTLLPGLRAAPLPEDRKNAVALTERLGNLEVEGPRGAAASPVQASIDGRVFRFNSNPLGWNSAQLQFRDRTAVLILSTADGEQAVSCGTSGWHTGELKLDMPVPLPVAATARWASDRTLDAALIYLSPGATRSLELSFDDDRLQLRTTLAGTFAPPVEVVLTGHAA